MPIFLHAPEQTLFVRQENGRYRPATKVEIGTANARLIWPDIAGRPPFSSPDVVRRFVKSRMQALEHEVFAMLVLDNRNRLIEYIELFRGTIDGASVHPREVVKDVLRLNGNAVILLHNHPSLEASPSMADEVITRRVKSALALVDVRLIDHLIIGHDIVSFAERGII